MNFLTQEEVKIAAEKGELPALECSLRHHQEGRDADYVELRDAIEKGHFNIDAELCACCVYAHDIAAKEGKSKCDYCPLEVAEESCCCDGKWLSTCQAFLILIHDNSNANFKAFQDAEAKLCTYIKNVIDKKKAEQEDTKTCNGCKHQPARPENIPCGICDNHSHWKPKESKPALRHGDYGEEGKFADDPLFVVVVKTKIGQEVPLEFVYSDGSRCPIDDRNIVWHGNFVKDLARNAEDLATWEMGRYGEGDDIASYIAQGGNIVIRIGRSHFSATSNRATEIAHKILQEVATARRKQNKK